jgi:hypothetical protein
MIVAYKLFHVRRDGSLGPLFINKTQRVEVGVKYHAENHPTTGYKFRPGWHCCEKPIAPHLHKKGRAWYMVKIDDYVAYTRPKTQGGRWFVAQYMTVMTPLRTIK